jgi:hypothetical protein
MALIAFEQSIEIKIEATKSQMFQQQKTLTDRRDGTNSREKINKPPQVTNMQLTPQQTPSYARDLGEFG